MMPSARLSSRPTPAARLVLAALLLALTIVACGHDESIRVYEVPKDAPDVASDAAPTDPHAMQPAAGPQRILAATIPVDDGAWFVKVQGPKESVEPFIDEFDAFVASLRFGAANPFGIEWTAPGNWGSLAPGQFATAKWRLDGAGQVFLSLTHLTIVPFGDTHLLENVNRWRRQLGLSRIDVDAMKAALRTMPVDGRTASIVDVSGAQSAASADPHASMRTSGDPHAGLTMPNPGGAAATPRKPAVSANSASSGKAPRSMDWTLPAGWTETGGSGMGRVATFRAEGDPPVEITVTKFPGDVGGKLANVNRWRRQVGLGPLDAGSLESEVETLAAADREVTLVDATGSSARILALMIPATQETWFVKAQGDPARLGELEGAFREFARTIRAQGD